MKQLLVFVTIALFMTSCGGGGNTVATFETPTLTAYYVDAPVKGLIYEASPSGLNGVTDAGGAFNFKQGDSVSFFIDPVNRIYLGRVIPFNGQTVIPPIATEFDSEVDSSFVTLILYTFDRALDGSTYMDLSDLLLNSSLAEKVRKLLSKKEVPNGIDDIWQSMSRLQSDATGYTFRNSGNKLSKLEFNLSLFNSVSEIVALQLNDIDYLGVHYLSYGIAGAYLRFVPNGTLIGVRDDGTLETGTYIKNSNSLSYRWSNDSLNSCNYVINLRQRGDRWSLITISEEDTPSGCVHNINHNDALRKTKINESVNIDFVSGKRLRIPANGFCTLGEGDAVFNISATGSNARQRDVTVISPLCTRNQEISGTVKESDVPGILVFEFENTTPKIKFFFSTFQSGDRALTQISVEKTVLNVEFDFVYGAETTFTLE